jgi:FHA domain-containing protein
LRFRLRLDGREIDLPPGDFVIGRASACHLRIDDHLVSRRHAVLHVHADGVTVEDAGSRNGVFVNDAVVKGRVTLRDGDTVHVGDAELVLSAFEPRVNETLEAIEQMRPVRIFQDESGSLFEQTQKPTSPSSLLLEVADKSLTMGRIDDAAWILGKFKADIDGRLAAGHKVTPETIEKTALYALKLARATRNSEWVDWVFDVHRTAQRVLPGPVIDELHPLVRVLRYRASTCLTDYVDSLRMALDSLSPADRFLVQRLEGLLDVVAAQ